MQLISRREGGDGFDRPSIDLMSKPYRDLNADTTVAEVINRSVLRDDA